MLIKKSSRFIDKLKDKNHTEIGKKNNLNY